MFQEIYMDGISVSIPANFDLMQSSKKKKEKSFWQIEEVDQSSEEIPIMINALKKVYKSNICEIEKLTNFETFYSSAPSDAYFESRPCVLLIGQYSVGKTTFIRYLLGRDFPGMRVGPEPTTDRFMCVSYGLVDRTIPGNSLCADSNSPWGQLIQMGQSFLTKFEGAECNCPVLKRISLIDTPGVLSGEKQSKGRGYDFPTMCRWFAGRCSRVMVLFDAHKLDISDEMKKTIDALDEYQDKILVVLNKADLPTQQLMCVYGALLWSLGKIFGSPEVIRVYVGSFWDKPLINRENQVLILAEKVSLMTDLKSLPSNVAVSKVNEIIKRAKRILIHAQICGYLRDSWSTYTFQSNRSQTEKLAADLGTIFQEVQNDFGFLKDDLPDLKSFQDTLLNIHIPQLPSKAVVKTHANSINNMLTLEIPKIMAMVPSDEGGIGGGKRDASYNPFLNTGNGGWTLWLLGGNYFKTCSSEYSTFPKTHGKFSADHARIKMIQSGLPTPILSVIWALSDIDEDGWLDVAEWTVCKFLMNYTLKQNINIEAFPYTLPDSLIPPSKHYIYEDKG